MNSAIRKNEQTMRRAKRTRARVQGTEQRPRLCITKSNRFVDVQLINDDLGITIVNATSRTMKEKKNVAQTLGEEIAKKATEKGITKAVCDRGPYRFHGTIKAIVESAKANGLIM